MKGIHLYTKDIQSLNSINKCICKIINILKRIFNKTKLYNLRNKFEKLEINYIIEGSSDDGITAMVGDRCHKLLQQALGQKIISNEYFVIKLLKESKERNLINPIIKWGQSIYDDYLKNNLYKHVHKTDEITELNNKLDLECLQEYKTIVHNRKSIRKYYPDKIDQNVLEDIISCGIQSPSSCNRQSWRFILFKDKIDKEYIAKMRNIKFLENVPVILCVLVNMEVYTTNAQGDRRITPIMDASAAMMNIINACTAVGLGSCWVNFIASVGEKNVITFKEKFNIPKQYTPVSLISIGYHNTKIKKPLRNELSYYWLNKK